MQHPNLDIVIINARTDGVTDGRKNERNDRQPKPYKKRGYNKCDQYSRTGF